MSVTLHVKHASKVYDVSIGSGETGLALKQQLESLTGVPVPRQKVMVKGRQLQDEVASQTSNSKDGQASFMLGSAAPAASATAAPQSRETAVGSAETGANPANTSINKPSNSAQGKADDDSSDSDMDDGYREPLGLVNVGNSCYANATLEASHTVPESNTASQNYGGSDQSSKAWAQSSAQFGHETRSGKPAPTPMVFMMRLQQRFPQFAELGEEGSPKQQDAEEFWTQLMWESRSVDTPEMRRVVESFDGRFAVTTTRPTSNIATTNTDAASSTASTEQSSASTEQTSTEEFTKLMCHININTNFLKDGLRASLVDEAETGVNESSRSTKRIARSPKYSTVQFVRFFWRRDTQKNSKISRKVTFPLNLDIGDSCTDESQNRMAPARDAYRELEGAIEESKRAARRAKFQRIDAVPEDSPADSSQDEDAKVRAKRRAAAEAEAAETRRESEHLEASKQKFRDSIDPELRADTTGSPHGLYESQAIVTHQGMSADSGHYQCFVRNAGRANSWWRFNDDRVSEVDDNRIAQSAGGGASDSASILLYKSAEI